MRVSRRLGRPGVQVCPLHHQGRVEDNTPDKKKNPKTKTTQSSPVSSPPEPVEVGQELRVAQHPRNNTPDWNNPPPHLLNQLRSGKNCVLPSAAMATSWSRKKRLATAFTVSASTASMRANSSALGTRRP